jgi:dihydrofolate reductase
LPGRVMVIITRDLAYRPENCPDCLVVNSLEAALDVALQAGDQEAFIGGGGEIFAQALPLANRIYLTKVHTRAGCDVFFPAVDEEKWNVIEQVEQPADEKNEFAFSYRVLAQPEKRILSRA